MAKLTRIAKLAMSLTIAAVAMVVVPVQASAAKAQATSKQTKPAVKADPPLSPDALVEIERTVARVGEPELRSALARLGAAVRRRRQAESEK